MGTITAQTNAGIDEAVRLYPQLNRLELNRELENAHMRLARARAMEDGGPIRARPATKPSTQAARSTAYQGADEVKNAALLASGGNPYAIGVALAAFRAACIDIDRIMCD